MAQYVAICRALSAGLLSILGKGTKGHYSLPSITITAANICGDHWFQVQKKKKESNVCYSVILIEQDSNTFNLLEVYKRTRADNPKVILGIYEQHQYCWQQLSQIKHCQVPYLTRVFFFGLLHKGFCGIRPFNRRASARSATGLGYTKQQTLAPIMVC